jgi:hypothetical protein
MKKYPGYQNLISFDPPETIRKRHEDILNTRNATNDDCRIVDLEPTTGFEAKKGYKSTYQLHWTTAIGWVCYMQHTGCYASLPE